MNAARHGVCNRLAFQGVCNRGLGARNATTPLFGTPPGQCSDIARDEREAEPGAGLLGNFKCTFRRLETLGGHKDWFGRSWEGLLGRPWPKRRV